jgi:hypothetical protein
MPSKFEICKCINSEDKNASLQVDQENPIALPKTFTQLINKKSNILIENIMSCKFD